MTYLPRIVDGELRELLATLPAVALEGAKGIGKTRTAEQLAASRFDLDRPATLAVAEADPLRVLRAEPPVLLDEWQHLPALWDLVRRAVDEGAAPGTFLLAGSAGTAGVHSGAGRIVRVRMRPLALSERAIAVPTVSLSELLSGSAPDIGGSTTLRVEDYVREICASGFPAIRSLAGRGRRAQLEGYVARVIDRDLPELDQPTRNPAGLRRWLAAYAAASSTTTAYERLREAATGGQREKPAKTTVLRYRDALERLWLLDPVPAWSPAQNVLSRLAAAPKHQLVDPALAAHVVGVNEQGLLEPARGQLLGQLFESLVTLGVRAAAQAAEATVSHFRAADGSREIDLVVERPDGRVVAIEVKAAAVVNQADVRHLLWLKEKLGDALLDAVIVTTGPEAYRRQDGVAVVPAALLGV